MKISTVIAAALLAAATAACAGEVKEDMRKTGHDIKEGAVDAGHAIKQESKEAALTTKVKAALAAEPGLRSLLIHVDTEDGGVVTLTGKVATSTQMDQAVNATKLVGGVNEVRNKLEVRS